MDELKMINNGSGASVSGADLETFKSNFRGRLVIPGDADYDEVRTLWNGMHDKKPGIIARCTGVADVMASVNFARDHQILLAVRGGGHNVGGSASCDGGIMIDLSLMKGVWVDPNTRTARAQGGATWGDVDRETQVFGLATPGGVVSTTGIAGLTLGGGLGWLRRKHGLTIDNLISVDIVTADGQFHTANSMHNADLFWAVRGGGGNFGIVTSFEYQLHPVGPMVTLCAPWYPAEEADAILPVWNEFMKTAPEELSSTAMFWTVPAAPGFPAEAHGKRALIIAAVHSGSLEDGARIIQPLRELGKPMLDLSGPIPWTALQSAFDGFFPKKQQLYYFKSRNLRQLDQQTIQAIIPQACKPPAPMILIAIWNYGGAMARVGEQETAFTGRQVPILFGVDAVWADPGQTEEVLAYSRNFLSSLEPYSTGGMYVNFSGLGEEGETLVKSAYGNNYERLVSVKNKYDPHNLFRLNQNIKPTV
ncbi:MAG TPA: FAD-binding oxidoreductase [Saprospiraceae bacterium]|nr:FAD-binding oxidoreductase [Saprospiraceae bacterium]HNT19098.1 FAD-binding oxidoreductase [Saprospiraceae bacterium]